VFAGKKSAQIREILISESAWEEMTCLFAPSLDVNVHLPTEKIHHFSNNGFDKRKLIKFETLRNFDYKHLEALNADKSLSDDAVSQQINLGVNLHDIKDWFAKRDLFEKVDNGYGPNTIKNIHLARECISILNPQFSYNRVDPKSYDIFVNTPTGVIWYEYLSSGFKSCMSLLLGIIKEIELRYPEQDLYAQEFDGVILIDEIELHLHPEWQARITEALTTTFPSAQFIVTTHSPHVVQNAKSHQIIALVPDNDGAVRVKELPENGLGYSAWTVEEVLLDVMGMESTLSRKLQELLDNFERFVDGEDFDKAKEDVNNIRQAMKSAKGPGNFRNLFMYSPNGKKDGIQIIPLSEVAAKDEFLNIKNVSRDDMMAAHRVPPQMMGIIPNNTGGFGDVEKASRVFVRNELQPLQKRLQELNDWLEEEVIRFTPYILVDD